MYYFRSDSPSLPVKGLYIFVNFHVNYTVLSCERNVIPLPFAIRIDNRMSHMIALHASLPLLRSIPHSGTTSFFSTPRKLAWQDIFHIIFFPPRLLWLLWFVRLSFYSCLFTCSLRSFLFLFFWVSTFFFAFLKVYLSVIDLQCCDNCCCVVFVLMKQRDGAEHFFSLNCFLTSVEFLDVFSIRQLGRPSES